MIDPEVDNELALTRKKNETLAEIEKLEAEVWGRGGHRDEIRRLEREELHAQSEVRRVTEAHEKIVKERAKHVTMRDAKIKRLDRLAVDYSKTDRALVKIAKSKR